MTAISRFMRRVLIPRSPGDDNFTLGSASIKSTMRFVGTETLCLGRCEHGRSAIGPA